MAMTVTTTEEVYPVVIGAVIGGVSILAVSILVIIVIFKMKQMKNQRQIAVLKPSEVTGYINTCIAKLYAQI